MNITKAFLFFLLSLLAAAGYAQNLEFVENKGQWNDEVKLRANLSTGAIFLKAQGYKVLQNNMDDYERIAETLHGGKHADEYTISQKGTTNGTGIKTGTPLPSDPAQLILRSHAYEVSFDQSNPDAEIVPEKIQQGYENYIQGNDPSKWAGNCRVFAATTYKNMYPGVDVRYYTDNGQLKFDVIVAANADLSKLAMNYSGTTGLSVKDGDLYIQTSVSTVKEKYPYAYQIINGVRTRIDCKYKLSGNTVRYQLGKYDKTQPLIIDPTLVFATYVGSRAENWGYTATYGTDGSMYGGGVVFGSGFPVTTGAFQTNFGGGGTTGEGNGYDIGIIKLNALGNQRLYATYIGGSSNEAPHSMIADARGNLVVAGRTTSKNFPVSRPFIGTAGSIDWDIVVFKLNPAGNALIGSIRLGGSSDDGVNIRNKYPSPQPASLMRNYGDDSRSEVIFDAAGNILVASCTQSDNFPITTATAFQTQKAGKQDGLLLKFDANLTGLTYGSFFGGNDDDAAYVLNTSPETGDIWIGGGTASTNLPGNTSGTIRPTPAGLIDGFVAVISAAGALLKTTYIGTSGHDQVYGLKFDIYGYPYIMGTSTGSFPVINAAFSQPGGKQFIAKLEKDLGSFVYFTNFGTNVLTPNISPVAFLVDRCQNVYVSGWGGNIIDGQTPFPNSGTAGMSVTPDAIQATTDGEDFYFFVLERDAVKQLYGSFFGQRGKPSDHVDGGTSRFDNNGIIYMATCSGGTRFPVTSGAWANGTGNGYNEALTKIEFNLAGITSGVKAQIGSNDGDTSGCVPLTIRFRDTILLAKAYEWNFGDGSPEERTTTATNSHEYKAVGTYLVRLIAIDSSKCFPQDTSYVNIRVREDYATVNALAAKVPPCTSTTYQFTNISDPYTGKAFTNQSFQWFWGDNSPSQITGTAPVQHTFPGIGTYNVKLVLEDTNFCNAPDTFNLPVRISPNVKATFRTAASGCVPYNASFNNTSLGGTSFFWDFGDGTNATTSSPTHLYNVPGTYTVKLIATDTSSCNFIDSTTFTITVSGIPTAAFSYTPNPAEENVMTVFTNLSNGAVRFKWDFGDDESLLTFRQDTTVRHQYNESRLYNACLIATNQFGCPDTTCLPVNAIVKPILDVPNAFTPNNDGVNDRAVVIGIGISKMTFRIFNRWGKMVFETNNRKQGWDGRFNGKPQPMDVYAYTLEAEFFDGVRTRKKGDITLLR